MKNLKNRADYLLGKVISELTYPPIQNFSFKKAVEGLWGGLQQAITFIEQNYGETPVVVGGLAVQLYGVTRMTEDIDILVSKVTYDKLVSDMKVQYGSLKIIPGTQIDVLSEGKDGNPHPDFVRGNPPQYPSLPGLIYLKIISGRLKDIGDVAELIKANYSDTLFNEVIAFLPENLHQKFTEIYTQAESE